MSNPEAPAGASRPQEPKSVRMSNSDFRKMMATPRSGESTSVYSAKFATPRKRSDSQAGLGNEQQQKKKKKEASAYWKKKQQEKEEEKDKVKYRDRAKERRMGKNTDYDEAERELLAGLNTGEASERAGLPNPAASVRGETDQKADREDYFRNLSIEQSKYLGGDEKHTHLVKGLDYALLAKMKSEMALAEENQKKAEAKNSKTQQGGGLEFGSASARGVYAALFQKHQKQTSNRFLFGKTTFLFNTSQDRTSGPPMTVIQSVEEGGAEYDDDYFHSPISQKILEQLKKISTYSKLGEGGKGRKRERRRRVEKTEEEKRREKEEEERAAKRREKEEEERRKEEKRMKEEDSIFGDIGDYVCKVPEKKGKEEKEEEEGKEVGKVGGYFDGSVFGEMEKEKEEEKEEEKEDKQMEDQEEEEDDDEGEEDMKIDDD